MNRLTRDGRRACPCALFVLLSMAAPPLAAQEGEGRVVGVVRDSLGGGINMAEVRVEGTSAQAVTGPAGEFHLAGVPAGSRVIHIRRLGYRPATEVVSVAARLDARIDVRLSALPAQLAPVEVRARPEVFDARLAGFHERRERATGHFITRERLDQLNSHRFVDVMREIPGVRVGMIRGVGNTIRMRGASCSPLVFIDGFPAAAGAVDLDMIDLATVEGIEVYSGLASVPPEFVSVRGGERCGVVAIWSRPYRAPRARPARGRGAVDIDALLATKAVFTAEQVDSPADLDRSSIAPLYPDALWRARVGGRVVVELVVEPTGAMRRGSLRVVSSTHDGFTSAVREALEAARFRAAVLGGRVVSQLIQLPFEFDSSDGDVPPPDLMEFQQRPGP